MIKLIDNLEDFDFSSFENDVFFGRIYSDYITMSRFDDALFYVSVEDVKVKAVISKVGGNITVSCADNSVCEEISEFVNIIGFSKILCDNTVSSCLAGKSLHGDILKIDSKYKFDCKAVQLYTENLRDMYSLIKENFDVYIDFSEWFVDMSYKLRHNAAKFCGIYEDGKLVSGAFSLFETEKSAVISSVVTDVNYRGRGYGEDIVRSLLNENTAKTVYVFTENDNIKKWYEKMGFVPDKKWSEIENVL